MVQSGTGIPPNPIYVDVNVVYSSADRSNVLGTGINGVSEGSGHERRGIINPATYSAGALLFPLVNINIPTSFSFLNLFLPLSVASSAIPLTSPSAAVSNFSSESGSPFPSSFSLAVYNAGILGLSAAYRNIAEYFWKMNFPFTRQLLITHFPHLIRNMILIFNMVILCTVLLCAGIWSLVSPYPLRLLRF